MPTPVMHLVIGERLLADPSLPTHVRDRLNSQRAAFLVGSIAPDLQVVSGQPRHATHFFRLPPDTDLPAYRVVLEAHPDLARPLDMPPDRAAFLAGYLAHLLFDETWVREVFGPVFGWSQAWATWPERLLWHNVLRTWIERQSLGQLSGDIAETLRSVTPERWLPFAQDADLSRWRDEIAGELEPGATVLTAQFFAERARVSFAEFQARLRPERLKRYVFSRITPFDLDRFHRRTLIRSRELVGDYLAGRIEVEGGRGQSAVSGRETRLAHPSL